MKSLEQIQENALQADFTEVQQAHFDKLMSELEEISGGLGFAELKVKAEAGSKEALQVMRDYITKKEQIVIFIETKKLFLIDTEISFPHFDEVGMAGEAKGELFASSRKDRRNILFNERGEIFGDAAGYDIVFFPHDLDESALFQVGLFNEENYIINSKGDKLGSKEGFSSVTDREVIGGNVYFAGRKDENSEWIVYNDKGEKIFKFGSDVEKLALRGFEGKLHYIGVDKNGAFVRNEKGEDIHKEEFTRHMPGFVGDDENYYYSAVPKSGSGYNIYDKSGNKVNKEEIREKRPKLHMVDGALYYVTSSGDDQKIFDKNNKQISCSYSGITSIKIIKYQGEVYTMSAGGNGNQSIRISDSEGEPLWAVTAKGYLRDPIIVDDKLIICDSTEDDDENEITRVNIYDGESNRVVELDFNVDIIREREGQVYVVGTKGGNKVIRKKIDI